MLFRTDVTPVVLVYFDLVLYAGMVAELRFLAFPNQSLDVVPVAPENAGVVGDGVILESGCGEAHKNSEFTVFSTYSCFAIASRFTPHEHHQVTQWVARIQQTDDFVVFRTE